MTNRRAVSPSSEPEPARKRRRPAKSCEPCRHRKVGCDQALPCGPCQRARKPIECFYRPEINDESHSRDGFSTKTAPALAQLSERNRAVPITALKLAATTGSSKRSVPPASGHDSTEDLASRVRNLESLLIKYETERSELPQAVDNRSKLLLRNNPEKTRIFGRSHWMYIAETLVRDPPFLVSEVLG